MSKKDEWEKELENCKVSFNNYHKRKDPKGMLIVIKMESLFKSMIEGYDVGFSDALMSASDSYRKKVKGERERLKKELFLKVKNTSGDSNFLISNNKVYSIIDDVFGK